MQAAYERIHPACDRMQAAYDRTPPAYARNMQAAFYDRMQAACIPSVAPALVRTLL